MWGGDDTAAARHMARTVPTYSYKSFNIKSTTILYQKTNINATDGTSLACTTTSLVTTYSYTGVVRHEHPTAPRRHVQVRFVVPHGICLIRRGGRMIVFCFGIQNKHTLNDLAQNPHLNLNLLLFARLFEDSIAHPLSTKRQIFAMIRIIPIARDGLLSNPCG